MRGVMYKSEVIVRFGDNQELRFQIPGLTVDIIMSRPWPDGVEVELRDLSE